MLHNSHEFTCTRSLCMTNNFSILTVSLSPCGCIKPPSVAAGTVRREHTDSRSDGAFGAFHCEDQEHRETGKHDKIHAYCTYVHHVCVCVCMYVCVVTCFYVCSAHADSDVQQITSKSHLLKNCYILHTHRNSNTPKQHNAVLSIGLACFLFHLTDVAIHLLDISF